jgi:hypothetical protein
MRVYEHGLLRKAQALRVGAQLGPLETLHRWAPPMSPTPYALACEMLTQTSQCFFL